MPAIQAVVFDVYKTLLDIRTDEESPESYAFLSQWLSYHGMEIDPLSLRLRYLELCREEIFRSSDPYPDFDIGKVFSKLLLDCQRLDSDSEFMSRELALLFRMVTTKYISVYPGVVELLHCLKGKARLGIVSNAQRLFTIPELSKFNLIDFFDAIVLSSEAGVRKPNPEIFHTLLDTLGVPPEAAVFVGDNLFDDVYGASQVGMKTIWINHGNRNDWPKPGCAQPGYEIQGSNYADLTALLLSLL